LATRKKNKIMSAKEAIGLIPNGATVTTSGFCGAGVAEEIVLEIEKQYLATQTPNNLTLVYGAGQGNFGPRGMSHLGHEGLIVRIISGYYGASPQLTKLVIDNKIPAHNLPQGVLCQRYRDIAARKPRTITTVGLKTFVDPRLEGGKVNSVTSEQMVELTTYDGKEYLSYKTFPIDVAILRGTTADEDGNISLEKEALTLETQAQAMAAKSGGGIVLVQVEQVVQRGTLHPKQVVIPSVLVDAVVVAGEEHHWQTFAEVYNSSFSGDTKVPMASVPPMKMSARKVIARRAAFELLPGATVNLGIGMPEGIANVANEEGVLDTVTLTAEPGIIGGMPASGLNFGAAYNSQAIIDQPSQFDFYHSGGLDLAFLGLAQVDRFGNLNVSKFGPKLFGSGGFIDITQNAKEVVFVGTFTAGGLDVAVDDGKLTIHQEGRSMKFVQNVEQVTFSGEYAVECRQSVLYITERCVFKLSSGGLELIEVAPGIDIEKDIIGQMAFKPIVGNDVKQMDEAIFRDAPMGLSSQFFN
jgi:propionate CoA-transferase